jgi:mannose-1-phosphate guanylyltransferase
MNSFAVILAGGTGTRLWPYSRRRTPKQLVELLGDASMLQETAARLDPIVPPDRIVVVTNMEYVNEVRRQLPDVPPRQVVGEPEALGTAAAVGLGAALVGARDESATTFVLPADHVIEPASRFRSDLERAAAVAAEDHLVTFGIPPTKPETGYGYVELAEALPGEAGAFAVKRFVEKPDPSTAQLYVESGRFLWNSGMFAWTVPAIRAAFDAHLPALGRQVDALIRAARRSGSEFENELPVIWSGITDRTTIDYGIMERSDQVACVPATFTWNDVGSWSALAEVLARDEDDNAVVGRHIGIDTTGTLVFGRSGRMVATIGLDDMVIVDTPDALLVCPKDRAQEVRGIVDELEQSGDTELL